MLQYTKATQPNKINQHFKKALCNWILKHPHVVVSHIANYCIKLSIAGQVEPQLVPKFLLPILVRELHINMVSPPREGGLKESRNAYNNIITSSSTLYNILPPQLKKITS